MKAILLRTWGLGYAWLLFAGVLPFPFNVPLLGVFCYQAAFCPLEAYYAVVDATHEKKLGYVAYLGLFLVFVGDLAMLPNSTFLFIIPYLAGYTITVFVSRKVRGSGSGAV